LLTDIAIEWNNLPVADVYPQRIPDLFGAKPLIVTGRYTGAGRGTIRLKGKMAGSDFVRDIPVDFPETMASHDVLAPLWARARVDNLMGQDFAGAQSGNMRADLKDTITQLGIEYRLMTQFTSFVAVEEMVVTDGGKPRRIDVPIEVPEGVKVVTEQEAKSVNLPLYAAQARVSSARPAKRLGAGAGGGIGGGYPSPPNSAPMVSSGIVSTPAVILADKDGPLDQQSRELQQKLHPSVFAIVQKLKKKETLSTADQAGFIRDGKAEVQVWLTDKSNETLTQLKGLDFEVVLDAKNSKVIIGRLPVEKLEELAKLKSVKYVSPAAMK
jgi:hypothetical protein